MGELFSELGIEPIALLAQAANFAVVLVALYYLVYRPLTTVVEERTKKIEQGLSDAIRAKDELARVDGVYAERMSEAEKEGTAIIKKSEGEARERATKIITDSAVRSADMLVEARTLAERTKDSEMRQLEAEAKEFVQAVITKTVGMEPDAIDAKLIEQAAKLVRKEKVRA
jgi:F-type H+-transporting ATPase subunit b